MLLHELLDETVADVTADLPALTAASRRDGVGIRRRRRVRTTVGSLAVVAVVAAGTYVLVPGDATTARDPGITSAPLVDAGPLSGETAPLTGRGAVAALVDAVDQVADGTFTDLSGADPVVAEDLLHDSSARFLFRPDSGGPATDVFLNVQRIQRPMRGADSCDPELLALFPDCVATALPGGDLLRTYTDEDSSSAPGYERRVAELLSPARDLRLVLGSSNTRDGDTGLVGVEPALSIDQLATVVTQPWWQLRRLPVEYVEAGERLPSYRDHGGSSVESAEPSSEARSG